MWITSDDIREAIAAAATDTYMDQCAAAADAFAQRRRKEAGYVLDDPAVSPGPDVTLGATLYGVALYRERGTVDSFASFDEFATGLPPIAGFGQVLRLLGVPRPAAA